MNQISAIPWTILAVCLVLANCNIFCEETSAEARRFGQRETQGHPHSAGRGGHAIWKIWKCEVLARNLPPQKADKRQQLALKPTLEKLIPDKPTLSNLSKIDPALKPIEINPKCKLPTTTCYMHSLAPKCCKLMKICKWKWEVRTSVRTKTGSSTVEMAASSSNMLQICSKEHGDIRK